MGDEISGAYSLSGKTALVTGGGKGIGKAIGERLARMGASVVLTATADMASARNAAQELRASGAPALAIEMDLTDRASVDAGVARSVNEFGTLDIVVNNAGATRRSDLLTLSAEDWDHSFDVNTRGFFYVAVAGAKEMIRGGRGGAIIAVAGASAVRSFPGAGGYGPSKAAVLSAARQMAIEWAPHSIRVNSVLPGVIRPVDQPIEPRLAAQMARILVRRPGTPEEIAEAVTYLATAEYVTGQDLIVDGGSTATWYMTN